MCSVSISLCYWIIFRLWEVADRLRQSRYKHWSLFHAPNPKFEFIISMNRRSLYNCSFGVAPWQLFCREGVSTIVDSSSKFFTPATSLNSNGTTNWHNYVPTIPTILPSSPKREKPLPRRLHCFCWYIGTEFERKTERLHDYRALYFVPCGYRQLMVRLVTLQIFKGCKHFK